jgi:putative tryptophan/tyrosine transport system substrate-binding protein
MLKGSLIAATLLSLALPAASQDKVWRAGLLSGGTQAQLPGVHSTWRTGVLRGLEQNGFRIGKNLELVDRYAEGDLDRLPELSREIATNNVDVVVAIADPSVRAMLAATKVTPIVMVVGADPVEVGFVTSLARPGGRVTGVAFQIFEGDVKRLQLLREAMPQARRFGYLRPPGTIPARATEALANAARQFDIELITRVAARLEPAAYEAAFSAMRSEGASGVLVASTQQLSFDVQRFAPIAQSLGLLTICEWAYMARTGCTLAYGHDLGYAHRRVGEYAARILKGTPPADLPVEQLDTWKLTVNQREAARVATIIPLAILARADEVIE